MTLDEKDLAALYRQATARDANGEGCLTKEQLLRAGANELSGGERELVVSHIARCSDCAREYRLARSVHSFASDAAKELRPRTQAIPAWAYAAAAMLVLAIPLLIWLALERQQDRGTIERLRHEIAARRVVPRDETPELRTQIAELSRPRVGVPIVDLDADLTRGAGEEETTVVVPKSSGAFALVLHAPGEIGAAELELVDGGGATVWSEVANAEGSSLTIVLQRALVPAGRYTIRLRSSGAATNFRFRVEYR